MRLIGTIIVGLLLGSCGGGGGGAGTGGAGGGGPGAAGGSTGSGGAASGGSGAGTGGGAGAGVGSVGACNIPAAWASCTSPFSNGLGSCTEIDQASGAFQTTCAATEFHMGQSCPGAPDLYGVCVAAVTVYYYSPRGASQWTQLGHLCPSSGGRWCQVQ